MESHDSCEKLVAVEAGLISPNLMTNIPFVRVPRRNGSPNKLTNCLLISVVTVLLVIVSYEIWQAVRREQLIREFEAETVPDPIEQLPLVPEDNRIQEMVEELKRVQNTLKELQEKIGRRDPLNPTTYELPITATGEPDADLRDLTSELLKEIFKEAITDGTEPSSSDELSTSTLDSPKYPIFGEDVIQQEFDNSENSKSTIIIKPINEIESGWRSIFSFHFGTESGESDTSEESNITESGGTETPNPAETEITNSEDGYWNLHVPEVFSNPFRKVYSWTFSFGSSDVEEEDDNSSQSKEKVEEKIDSVQETQTVIPPEVTTTEQSAEEHNRWFWEFGSSYEEDSDSSESEENVEEKIDSVETETVTPAGEKSVKESSEVSNEWIYWGFGSPDVEDSESSESKDKVGEKEEKKDSMESLTFRPPEFLNTKESSETYDDDYYYENDDSYEDGTWLDHFSDYKSEDSLFTKEYPDYITRENPSTETSLSLTVNEDHTKIQEETTIGAIAVSIKDESKDNEDEWYRLGSPTDRVQLSTLDTIPKGQDSESGSSSSGEGSEESSKQYDPAETKYASADEYLELLFKKRLAEAALLSGQHSGNEEDEEYMGQHVTGYYDHDLESSEPTLSSTTFDDWSYISKRSVDTQSEPETSSRHLTSKELDQKMVLLLQAIDDDNHLLQNEVSLAPEPTKYALQAKLNNFYAKMDAVSAHIDRLHERYLRINKLDDDYVSKEFPTDELDTTLNPEN